MGSLAHITKVRWPLIRELQELEANGIRFKITETGAFLAHDQARSSLVERVKEVQRDDPELSKLMDNEKLGKAQGFSIDERDVLWFENRLCVSNVGSLRRKILEEAHDSTYVVHHGITKMY